MNPIQHVNQEIQYSQQSEDKENKKTDSNKRKLEESSVKTSYSCSVKRGSTPYKLSCFCSSDGGTIETHFNFNNKEWRIEKLKNQGKNHVVWSATPLNQTDSKIKIIKTYEKLTGRQKTNMIADDAKGYDRLSAYLKQNPQLPLRMAQLESNLQSDSFMLMEYVEQESTYSWDSVNHVKELPDTEQKILSIIKEIFEKSYSDKFDLGDFRAENVHWNNNQLVIVDYTNEDDPDDFKNHFAHYIADWSKKNRVILSYLSAELPEEIQKLALKKLEKFALKEISH